MIKPLLSGLLDLFFPRNCILCRRYDPATASDPLCPACFQKVRFNHPPFCLKCSRPLPAFSVEGLCRDCLDFHPAFDYAWAATLYAGPVEQLLPRYKFHNTTSLRKTFSGLIRTFLDRYELRIDADIIVPLPLHPTRLRERGYNQAALIAEALAQSIGIPLVTSGIERTRHTSRQSELGRKERFTNIKSAFRITRPNYFEGRHVLLVDDLITTGATVSEAALALKSAKANRVGVLALAIA